jgi:hypothetical protein
MCEGEEEKGFVYGFGLGDAPECGFIKERRIIGVIL